MSRSLQFAAAGVALALVVGAAVVADGGDGIALIDGAEIPATTVVDLETEVLHPPDGSELGRSLPAPTTSTTRPVRGGHGYLGCEDQPDGTRLCVHGSELPPPGVDPHALPSVAQLRSRRFGASPPPGRDGRPPEDAATGEEVATPEAVAGGGEVECVGDGVSGPRVQAIYAHAADRADRYVEVLPLIRQYAADVETRLNLAAGRSSQGRAVRYVTTGSPCVLDVDNVTLSTAGDDTFAGSVNELRARGYSRADRKYLVWVDAAVGVCGVGHVYADDRPTLDNANTRGNMFARADAPCWGYAELHELLHTLGAVQDSAPQSTDAGHCYDEIDTMCYQDTSGRATQTICANEPAWNVDCRLDDYFNAAPAAGSYLDTHWNSADNPYLEPAAPPPAPPELAVSSASRAYAGNAWTVKATPTLPPGRTIANFTWTTSRPDCRFESPTSLTTRYWCPVQAAGEGRVRAWLLDSADLEVTMSKVFQLVVPSSPRATSLSLARSPSEIPLGRTADVRSRLVDRANGNVVIGMPVSLYRRPPGGTTWEKIATKSTNSQGIVAFTVKPTRTTDYRTASGRTSTWATSASAAARVTVRPA